MDERVQEPVAGTRVHGVRTSDVVWKKAKARAAQDGASLNHAIVLLLEGYALGFIDLPAAVKKFPGSRP